MTNFRNRYASAVRSKNLRSEGRGDEHTTDADVIAAAGLAGRAVRTLPDGTTRKGTPMAMALLRLYVGDKSAVDKLVANMREMVRGKAFFQDGEDIPATVATDIAKAVLGWHVHGVCKVCKGRKFKTLHEAIGHETEGRQVLSDQNCPACKGTGRVDFDGQFALVHLGYARWLLTELEREHGIAEAEARHALGNRA
jgi:hypothetical protein